MRNNKVVPIALASAVLGGLAFLPGCGGGGGDNGATGTTEGTTTGTTKKEVSAAGKQLFVERCGSCHILADAGTSGQAGPNLDTLKRSAPQVADQIKDPKGSMPANLVTGDDVDKVAEYVSKVSGK